MDDAILVEVFHSRQDLLDHQAGVLLGVDTPLQDPVKKLPARNTVGARARARIQLSCQVKGHERVCSVALGTPLRWDTLVPPDSLGTPPSAAWNVITRDSFLGATHCPVPGNVLSDATCPG